MSEEDEREAYYDEMREAYMADLRREEQSAHEAECRRLEEAAAGPCMRCEGCGKIANSDEGEPWTHWERLPEAAKVAVRLGLVRPIACPDCRPGPEARSDAFGTGMVLRR